MSADATDALSFTTNVLDVDGEWPSAPVTWSYSSLRQAEACPRSWALSRASYPAVWSKAGYPPVPAPSALTGQAVHRSLERIVDALVTAGYTTTSDPGAVTSLRQLGGYTEVLKTAIEQVLVGLEINPRAAPRMAHYRRYFTQRLPEMRRQTQALVARVDLASSAVGGVDRVEVGRDGTAERPPAVSAPYAGVHSELQVSSKQLRFSGRMDMVKITGRQVQITDFKTGAPSPHHMDQLRTYEVLWEHRDHAEASDLHVTRLSVAYADQEVTLDALPVEALAPAADELLARIHFAAESINMRPPEARPSEENCRYCQVRHLCDLYWSWLHTLPIGAGITDVPVEILASNGPKSWRYRSGDEVGLLRAEEGSAFRSGDRYRLLAAHRKPPDDDSTAIVSMTSTSEVFALRSPPAEF